MKVGRDIRSRVERKPVRRSLDNKQSFEKIVQTESHYLRREELVKLVEDITEQGKKIARFRSFRDLAKFKRMIKEFLQMAVYEGLKVKETRSFNTTSFSHQLVTVQEIDEKLVQLTEDLMDQEKKTVDLLALIGEIEGLLVNLYT